MGAGEIGDAGFDGSFVRQTFKEGFGSVDVVVLIEYELQTEAIGGGFLFASEASLSEQTICAEHVGELSALGADHTEKQL